MFTACSKWLLPTRFGKSGTENDSGSMGSATSKVFTNTISSDEANEVVESRFQPAPDAVRQPVASESQQDTEIARLCQKSNEYKEGSFSRILSKASVAGILGLLLGPIANRGRVVHTASMGAANAFLTVGFYDLVREALTATSVIDSPICSGAAGALTGVSSIDFNESNHLSHQYKSTFLFS
jgi:hypothetical protein